MITVFGALDNGMERSGRERERETEELSFRKTERAKEKDLDQMDGWMDGREGGILLSSS